MRPQHSVLLVCLFLVAASLLVYAPAFHNDFVDYDDGDYVTKNARVMGGLTAENAWWGLTTTHAANWHPLTWWSLQLDSTLFPPASGRPNPFGYHATNVILHTASTILLFLVFWRMTLSVWRSAIVAAFFALHPLHVESVAWVSERKDVLCAFFWMLSLLAYVHYVERPGVRRYLLIVAAFVLALLAKPMAVTLPCVLLLLDYWPLKRLALRGVWEKLPLFAISALSCAATWYAQNKGGAMAKLTKYTLEDRVANAIFSYVRYIGKMIWPVDLVAFYRHPQMGLLTWQVLAAGLFLVAVTSAVIVWGRRWGYLPVGWFWYLGTLVPVIGLVQVGGQGMADRYTYLPLIGLFLMATWGLADLAERAQQVFGDLAGRWNLQHLAACGTGLLLLIAALYSWAQLSTWHDGKALWEHALAIDPDNPVANRNLGKVLVDLQDYEGAKKRFAEAARRFPDASWAHDHLGIIYMLLQKPADAKQEFLRALEIQPDNPSAHNNLGMLYEDQGNLEEAIREYRETARLKPNEPEAHAKLAIALEKHGNRAEAIEHFAAAVRLNPKYADVHYRLGLLLADAGRLEEACEHYLAALPLVPAASEHLGYALLQQEKWQDAATHLQQAASSQSFKVVNADSDRREIDHVVQIRRCLGYALSHLGNQEAARQQYQEASRLKPDWTGQTDEMAWKIATNPDASARNARLAQEMAEQVCQATQNKEAKFLDTLAAAYAERGLFDKATANAELALRLARANGKNDLAKEIEARLTLYKEKTAYRSGAPRS